MKKVVSDVCTCRTYSIKLPRACDKSSVSVRDTLELVCCGLRYASRQAVTVVDACGDECVYECVS